MVSTNTADAQTTKILALVIAYQIGVSDHYTAITGGPIVVIVVPTTAAESMSLTTVLLESVIELMLQNCWHYFSWNYMYKLANFFMILNTNLRHVWRICSSYYYHRSQLRQHIEIADVVTTFSWLNQKLVIYIIIKLLSWLTTMTKQICPVLNIVYYPSNKDINPVIICFGFWSSNL